MLTFGEQLSSQIKKVFHRNVCCFKLQLWKLIWFQFFFPFSFHHLYIQHACSIRHCVLLFPTMPWCLTIMISHCAVSVVLSVLMLLLRRHKRKQQEGLDVGLKELELPDTVSQKVLHYGETGGRRVNFCQPAIPLHPQPRRRERRLRKEEVRASIRMSLGESHFIGPEDEVFRQFILDRLAEADQDPYVPPFDCLQTYAYEGSGSPTGSLSSLDSLTGETELVQPLYNPRAHVVKLSPWCGSGEEDTTFWGHLPF